VLLALPSPPDYSRPRRALSSGTFFSLSIDRPISTRGASEHGENTNFFVITHLSRPLFFRFNTIKGFGFIIPDDGSEDIFVHQTAIQADGFRSLADGESVEFTVEEDSNGRKKASKVTGPDGANVQGAPFRPENDYGGY